MRNKVHSALMCLMTLDNQLLSCRTFEMVLWYLHALTSFTLVVIAFYQQGCAAARHGEDIYTVPVLPSSACRKETWTLHDQ